MALRQLARETACRHCDRPVFIAICADGKWRTFEREDHPRAAHGVWAWRKRQGMQETDQVGGKHLHYCAEYFQPDRLDLGALAT